jgi:hypothetical protein
MSHCFDCRWWDRGNRTSESGDAPAICIYPNANPKDFYVAPTHVCAFFELDLSFIIRKKVIGYVVSDVKKGDVIGYVNRQGQFIVDSKIVQNKVERPMNSCQTCIYWESGRKGDRFPNAAPCLCPSTVVSNTGPNFWCCEFKDAFISKKELHSWNFIDGPTERLINHLNEITGTLIKMEKRIRELERVEELWSTPTPGEKK